MNQITIDKNILLVEVPVDANGFDASDKWECFAYYEGEPSFESMRMINISPGNWQFIGTTDEVSEEIAAKILLWFETEWQKRIWRDYLNTQWDYTFDTALESYQSWLRANSINDNIRYAILKLIP